MRDLTCKEAIELSRRYPLHLKPFLGRPFKSSFAGFPGSEGAEMNARGAMSTILPSADALRTSSSPNAFNFDDSDAQFQFSDSFFNTPFPQLSDGQL